MQKGDVIRARFMTLPDLFPGKGCEEKKFPIRKGAVVYVHPKGRYIVAECSGERETFFPEDIIQCDVPGPPPKRSVGYADGGGQEDHDRIGEEVLT